MEAEAGGALSLRPASSIEGVPVQTELQRNPIYRKPLPLKNPKTPSLIPPKYISSMLIYMINIFNLFMDDKLALILLPHPPLTRIYTRLTMYFKITNSKKAFIFTLWF